MRNKFSNTPSFIENNLDVFTIAETKLDYSLPVHIKGNQESISNVLRLDMSNKKGG